MRAMRWLVGVLMIAVIAVLAAFGLGGEVNRFRYRIVLDVDTPSGPVQGSTVLEVEHRRMPDFWGSMANEAPDVKGEAVFVDLGGGRMLVAVLTVPDSSMGFLPVAAFDVDNRLEDQRNERFRRLARMAPGTSVVLPTALTPRMLVLLDASAPASARAISPDTFTTVLGPGYRLQQARVEIVPKDTPLNDTLRQKLPWWDSSGRPAISAVRAAGIRPPSSAEELFSTRTE